MNPISRLMKGSEWKILINTLPGHFKFWAYRRYEGDVFVIRYGKIGTVGKQLMANESDVLKRKSEKIGRKGYQICSNEILERHFPEHIRVLWDL